MSAGVSYLTCKNCTHTINIHTVKGEVVACGAYKCDCEIYVRK